MCWKNATDSPHSSHSLAVQLGVMYAVSMLILLAIAEGYQFWMHVSVSRAADARFLVKEVQILRIALAHYPADSQFLTDEVRWKGESRSRRYSGLYVRVIDMQGHTLIATPDMERRLTPDMFPVPVVKTDALPTVTLCRIADVRYALTAARVPLGTTKQDCILQVALDRTAMQSSIDRHMRKMLVVLAIGLLASSLLGYLLAYRGLRPIREMASVVQHLSAANIDQRLGSRRWPTELTTFALSFDGMLNRLQDAFVRLTHFSADIAHELRTPLQNLRNEAEVTLSQQRSAEEYRDTIGSSLEEYERLSTIVDSLLFLARADAINTVLECEKLDARRVVEDMAELYDAIAEEQGVAMACDGEAIVHADPVLLRRAISNLLSNALKHTPAGASISLSVEQGNQQVRILVRDTGCGIAPEHLPHVFDRFYRVGQMPFEQARGIGLGLPIVKSIMDLHGGAIDVTSEVGMGTTVTLVFPV